MDFTYDSYADLLARLSEAGYRFARFPQADALLAQEDPFVLLRHDVDLDLAAAARMAQIEASMGVTSTYFVMVRTEFYNVFSQAGTAHVRTILANGHDLGLHFDCAAYAVTDGAAELAEASRRECDLLERWFDCPIETISIHRPQPNVLAGDPALTAPRPHTYMDLYTKRIHYVADSRGGWFYGEPLAQPAFHQRKPMQLLVHPIWWQESAQSPLDTLHNFEARRQAVIEEQMGANSTIYRPRSESTLVTSDHGPVPLSALQPLSNGHSPAPAANGRPVPAHSRPHARYMPAAASFSPTNGSRNGA